MSTSPRDALFAQAQACALQRATWRQRADQGGHLFYTPAHCRGLAREAERTVIRLANLTIRAARIRAGWQA